MLEHENDTRVRLRRTKSVTRAEEIQKAEMMMRQSQPDKPCHRPKDSLFSWSSGFDNFTGFVNWGFLLLGIGGIRLLLENFIKYGLRVDPSQWILFLSGKVEGSEEYPSILLVIYSNVPIVMCLLIEKGLSVDIIAHGPGMVFHVVNLIVMILIPMVVIQVKDTGFSLFGGVYVCMLYAVLFLKLWAYVQVNMWCRRSNQRKATKQGRIRRQSLSCNNLQLSTEKQNGKQVNDSEQNVDGTALVQYPDNLSLSDLYYYVLAPTLCYELNFPRSQRIRKRFLIKRIIEVVVGCQVMMSLFQQWMIPSVKNSLVPFSKGSQSWQGEREARENVEKGGGWKQRAIEDRENDEADDVEMDREKACHPGINSRAPCTNMDVAKASERLLKLAIPNHLIWLCFFYLLYHSALNMTGELLYFADRNFYNDWWNAPNIEVFWRTWNVPVHRWALRHLYIPAIEMGYSKSVASATVFFISAFFHEYLVSVPLKTFRTWAFMGMMAQIPLSMISKAVEKHCGARWGNILVWASLIIGQPLCIMMYYHDYVMTHLGEILAEDYDVV
ncbi:Diacylglycerol O-acyltransferase 1 [Habropoda laboriosa]|uniref:O-acyltransferase n=1 Tax=Habropoda laboriosa TaxID=597456 RepID=A0A0L7R431_9HYME|nr:Diacylglycerol O-acyltransferase 1 [Habropoda laboriosa]